jgi:hypothetical protein
MERVPNCYLVIEKPSLGVRSSLSKSDLDKRVTSRILSSSVLQTPKFLAECVFVRIDSGNQPGNARIKCLGIPEEKWTQS